MSRRRCGEDQFPGINFLVDRQQSAEFPNVSATPTANYVPQAGAAGTIADGWLSAAISRITSIALAAPAQFSVSGSPLTANGTITLAWLNQLANVVLAGPASGADAAPTFRALVAADIPAHAASHKHGGADEVATATAAADAIPKAGAAGTIADAWLSSAISRITSIGLAAPAQFSVSGSPLTANGTLTLAWATQAANIVFAGPSSGGAAAPAFRSLVEADIPNHAYTKLTYSGLTSGQVLRASGATAAAFAALAAGDIPNLDSAKITSGEIPRSPLTTRGDLLTENPSGTHVRLAVGASGRYLRSNGTDPSYAQLDMADAAAGTLAVARGGTGLTASVGARAYKNANKAITSGVITAIDLNAERWDTDGMHDNATNNTRLTCVTAGYYLLIAMIEWAQVAGGRRVTYIRLNGATILVASEYGSAADAVAFPQQIATVVYPLTVGDYVELTVYQSQGGNVNVNYNTGSSPELTAQLLWRT